ncbi:MAG: hypothetical protein U0359_27965 [Byssovorax sp.]
MTVHPKNPRLLDDLSLFVVCPPDHLPLLDLRPFGLSVPEEGLIDPLRDAASPFMERLVALDRGTFGPEDMPMPRFLFYDASALPSAIIGFTKPAHHMSPASRAVLGLGPADEGLVPVSMYIAMPMIEKGVVLGHNLASMAERLPDEDLAGLGRLTKAVALKVLGATAQVGMTQWDSRALHVHTRMGPLDLLTAWTPAHATPASLTYRAHLDDAALLHLAGDPAGSVERPQPELWIDSDDHAAMQALQERIEGGERFRLVAAPARLPGGRQRSPIAHVTRARAV